VAAIVEDIDGRDFETSDDLLLVLLRTCWPTVCTQRQ
jgi:hypothetical protein